MLNFGKTLFFSLLFTFALVLSVRALEYAVNDAVKKSTNVSVSEYEFQEPTFLMDDGIRGRAVTQNSLRFPVKNQVFGFSGLMAVFVALFLAFSKNFVVPSYGFNLFLAHSNFPKYLLFRQILV